MTAYISVSFSQRNDLRKELRAIAGTLTRLNIRPFIFVDCYQFHPDQEKQMMEQALRDLNHCDLLIAETSHKGIGIGIEAGYAKAKGKPVIYVRQQNAAHSTTVSGISDFQIVYADLYDLEKKLEDILAEILSKKQAH